MGSLVFGYELTSFGNLSDLLNHANEFNSEEKFIETSTLLSSLLALTAIFGNLYFI